MLEALVREICFAKTMCCPHHDTHRQLLLSHHSYDRDKNRLDSLPTKLIV